MDKLEIPPGLRSRFRREFLMSIENKAGIDQDETELFDWFVQETDGMIDSMLATERTVIQEQVDSGREDINDSGLVAVGYFAKRMRYSHVIFLTSLFETYLDHACTMLRNVIGEGNMPFTLEELAGDKWSKRRRFLQRYGHFEVKQTKWETVEVLTLIRNVLVHENGRTTGITEKNRKRLDQHPGLRLDGYEVIVEPEFIKAMSSELKLLINEIHAEIQKVASRAIKPQGIV